jgi:hypothetical protein
MLSENDFDYRERKREIVVLSKEEYENVLKMHRCWKDIDEEKAKVMSIFHVPSNVLIR